MNVSILTVCRNHRISVVFVASGTLFTILAVASLCLRDITGARGTPAIFSDIVFFLEPNSFTKLETPAFRRLAQLLPTATPTVPTFPTTAAIIPTTPPLLSAVPTTAPIIPLSIVSTTPPATSQHGHPLSLTGSFVAHGISLTKMFVETAVTQTLGKMFEDYKASIHLNVSSKSIASLKDGTDKDNFRLSFSCSFQVCTRSKFFDRAYFLMLLDNTSIALAHFSHIAIGAFNVDEFKVASKHPHCEGVTKQEIPISFGRLGQGGACFAHHLVEQSVGNLEICARACAFHPGCVVFSFGGTSGCRISSCAHPLSKRHSAYSCGHSEGGMPTLRAQCATRPFVGSDIYYLIGLEVIGVHVGCDFKYIPFPTLSPLRCSQACQSNSECNVFSFSSTFGCRLSACHNPLSVGGDISCVGGHGHHMGLIGQCVTETRKDAYLYALTLPKLVKATSTAGPAPVPAAAPSGGYGYGGGGGGESSSAGSSGSSASLGGILTKIFLPVCVGLLCIVLVGLIAYFIKKLKDEGRFKQCLELFKRPKPGITITFNTGDGTDQVSMTFTELPLSLAFWDEMPLKVCRVKENSEAQRFGVKEGWIATHVNGKLLEGETAWECIASLNTIALRGESAGSMKRVSDGDGL